MNDIVQELYRRADWEQARRRSDNAVLMVNAARLIEQLRTKLREYETARSDLREHAE